MHSYLTIKAITMDIEELTPTIEELKRVLEGKVDENTIIRELDTYLNIYRSSLEEAKRGIMRKYGDDIEFVSGESVLKKVEKIQGNEQNVDVLVKVLHAEEREINVKGEPKKIVTGIVGDDSGTIPFTAWEPEGFVLEKGGTYYVHSAYAKTWNESPQLNLGKRTKIEKDDSEVEVPTRVISYSSKEAKISELTEGMNNVTVTAKVLSVFPKEITAKGEPRTIITGTLADESGKVEFSSWTGFPYNEGDVVRIENAYVRSWRGIPQLNLGDRVAVSKVDDDIGEIEELKSFTLRTIDDLETVGGGLDVELQGTIVDIRNGSGLIKRCPECRRSVLNDECITHGKVTAEPDLRIKAVIDDGTGALSCIINRELSESISGISMEEALKMTAEHHDPDVVAKEIESRLLARPFMIRGNVLSDEYGLMMIAREIAAIDIDIKKEARELLSKLEAML
ncbi:MAG: hypothetical protein PWQ88_488 [Candidatus Methanomethylophilaceae archaeon]|nr:hypothetical protein [Candidatus Methanomethylophilaceae archaeon]MDI3541442.1 hypothetical protein [Candidatus Methanomethylophilaceae archaeon]